MWGLSLSLSPDTSLGERHTERSLPQTESVLSYDALEVGISVPRAGTAVSVGKRALSAAKGSRNEQASKL